MNTYGYTRRGGVILGSLGDAALVVGGMQQNLVRAIRAARGGGNPATARMETQ